MATRFYMPAIGETPIVPASSGLWDQDSPWTILLTTQRQNTALYSDTISKSSLSNGDVLARRGVCATPLAAQTITGTCTYVIGCVEDLSSANAYVQVRARVVSADGQTTRGHLLSSPLRSVSEMGTTVQRRTATGSVTSVTAQNGDYLVVEIGAAFLVSASGYSATLRYHDNSATDMTAANGSGGTTDNPWIEFSQDLTFYTPPTAQATVTRDWNGNLVAIKRWSDA